MSGGFSPTVFQEVFVKVAEAAWSDSAPGSAACAAVLVPGTTQSQVHEGRRAGCNALCCVTIY